MENLTHIVIVSSDVDRRNAEKLFNAYESIGEAREAVSLLGADYSDIFTITSFSEACNNDYVDISDNWIVPISISKDV